MATKSKKKLVERDLRESVHTSGRVNREEGVIYGVKVLGRESRNGHGLNVQGTKYSPAAIKQAISLYEGRRVNINHPDRSNPNSDRSANDRFGVMKKVREEAGGVYGDLHFLKSHAMAGPICEAAERMPEAFSLSHHAFGRGRVEGDYYVIDEIPSVHSVDVVADGGSVNSLFESEQRMSQKTIRESLEALKLPSDKLKRLFELEMPAMDPSAKLPGGDANDEGWEAHLANAIIAILKDGALSPEDKRNKVQAAIDMLMPPAPPSPAPTAVSPDAGGLGGDVTPPDAGAGDASTPPSSDAGSDTYPPPADADGDGDTDSEDDMKKLKESEEKVKSLEAELGLVRLCESQGFKPSETQKKALLKLDSDDERTRFIQEIKPVTTGPRSRSPHSGDIRESQQLDFNRAKAEDIDRRLFHR